MIVILTIGHSTHPIEEFLETLAAHGVEQLIDVRTIPKSRRNPQFHQESLAASLEHSHIGYQHMPGLGGLRHARKDSINTGWKNASFRGYADYMQTPGFVESLGQLINAAEDRRTVIMCAEAVPWRCHRSLIADALVVRGVEVFHIMTPTTANPHELSPMAVAHGHHITYPGPRQLRLDEP